jgi:deoxyribonuclease V
VEIKEIHPWPKSQRDALNLQDIFKDQLVNGGSLNGVRSIAGIDTAFDHNTEVIFAGVCLFRYPGLKEYDCVTASGDACFPYVPGLHAFREGPVILNALRKLKSIPDLLIFAGHGLAHPRQFGLASHLGLIADIPSIGCARKRLAGQFIEVGPEQGDSSSLIVANREIGKVYRSREGVKPIYISPGHRCGVEDAVKVVANCLRGYRVPEPLRAAHRLANRAKRGGKKPVHCVN